jgi:hypothetical protein
MHKPFSQHNSTDQSLTSDSAVLGKKLDYLPQAIKQAASYVRTSRGRPSLTGYLKLFNATEQNQKKLLENTFSDETRNSDLSNAVILTLEISMNLTQTQRPGSSKLLSILSLLSRETIPMLVQDGTEGTSLNFRMTSSYCIIIP